MRSFVLTCGLMASSLALGGEPDREGFVALLDGNDLGDWVNVNCAPETWLIADGVIKCTGQPTGALRMAKPLENFILEVDWRHLQAGGNAGIFVWGSPVAAPGVPFLRAIEVQVLDNGYDAKGKNEWFTTHGDVFPIHGSSMKPIFKGQGMRCFPIEERSHSAPEWNHYRIEANAGKLRLSVNGKEVSGGDDCLWRKGYLGLESEGSPTEWKHLRLKELPSTGATAEQSAPLDEGWRSLFNGVDLRGWTATLGAKTGWRGGGWSLTRPVKPEPTDDVSCGLGKEDFVLLVDWREPSETATPTLSIHDASGHQQAVELFSTLPKDAKRTAWHRLTLARHDTYLQQGELRIALGKLDARTAWSLHLAGSNAPVELANIYLRATP